MFFVRLPQCILYSIKSVDSIYKPRYAQCHICNTLQMAYNLRSDSVNFKFSIIIIISSRFIYFKSKSFMKTFVYICYSTWCTKNSIFIIIAFPVTQDFLDLSLYKPTQFYKSHVCGTSVWQRSVKYSFQTFSVHSLGMHARFVVGCHLILTQNAHAQIRAHRVVSRLTRTVTLIDWVRL